MKNLSKKLFLLLLFNIIIVNAFPQENLIYEMIQREKSEFTNFKTISSALFYVEESKNLDDWFLYPEEISYLQYNPLVMKDLSEAIILTIPTNNNELLLELLEVDSSFYNYEVVTDDGKRYHANEKIRHYRGVVKDDPKSIVAITFSEDEMIGMIATEEGNFNLVYDKKLDKYLFYNDKNMKQKMDFECSTQEFQNADYDPNVLFQKSNSSSKSISDCVYFYFETEFDIFQTRGGLSSVETFITGIYNQVATLYQNENINTLISEIFIWTSIDPYTANDPGNLLSQFQNNRTNINGNLGQLLTFRNIGGGKAAGFEGICNSSIAQKLSVAMLYNSYSVVPNYSWSVFVVTHELGHLFGSRHTHACVWNGNNTAIDGCFPTEGDCSNPGIPSAGGTIMSYCHNIQEVGINFNLGFGTQPGNVIRNSVENGSCLCECFNSNISGPSILCFSGETYRILNVPDDASITWSWSSGIALTTAQGLDTCIFIATNSGTIGWIGVSVSLDGITLTLPQKTIWLGGVPSPELYANNATLTGSDWYTVALNASDVYFYLVPDPAGSPIYPDTWDVEGDSSWYTNGSFLEFFPNTVGENIVAGYRHNVCGFNGTYFTIEVVASKSSDDMGEISFKLDPNPAKEYVDITLSLPVEDKDGENYQVDFVNTYSRVVKQVKLSGTSNRVNIQDLTQGYYVVILRYNGEIYSNKLIVE